jgi:hypothetical protein
VEVASRCRRLTLRRQVLVEQASGRHVMPGNAVLPPHGGIVITRGVQEMACLLPDTLPFGTAARLLGWQTQEAAQEVLCASTLRTLVREHGATLAQAEQAEVTRLSAALAAGGAGGLRSEDAKRLLASLPSADELMPDLSLEELERGLPLPQPPPY